MLFAIPVTLVIVQKNLLLVLMSRQNKNAICYTCYTCFSVEELLLLQISRQNKNAINKLKS